MKKSRAFDPRRLDIAAFAEQGAALSGQWPLAELTRLAASGQAAPGAEVAWSVRGERRAVHGGEPELWIHLDVNARLHMECQRCLGPVETVLEVDRRLRFVAGEEQAAVLDADSDDDVLALERAFDLRELAEDELLLALPLVPRHEQCAEPLILAADPLPPETETERPNPFAVLQQLKPPGAGH